ncbi:MAG: hypothetical protein JXQ65_06835 [Candidatus Marinimicrobia bacterium]|nr:hypothetical protein [Candidatus Neomarinimicrobiota bacterium]
MKTQLLILFSLLIINCAYIHPPITLESVNNDETSQDQGLIRELVKNAEENEQPIKGSVSVLPFTEKGKHTGLGLAASEFFTSNLSLFSKFTLIDRSMTNTLHKELSTYSPEKKKKALRAEQLVSGEVFLIKDNVKVSGKVLQKTKEQPFDEKSGGAEQFFQIIADMNIQFFENNGITVSDEIANQLYEIPTENIQAYIYYSEGRYEESLGNLRAAAKSYQQAVKLDPNFKEPEERLMEVENAILTTTVSEIQPVISENRVLEETLVDPIVMQPNLEERAVPTPVTSIKVIINFDLP